MSKINLTEATMLALQGKLEESKPTLKKRVAETRVNKRRLKKENIDVNVDDQTNVSVMGNETIVDTPDATVVVDKKEDEFTPEQSVEAPVEEPVEEPTETIEVPVEGDETIVPEVDVPTDTPDVDLPLETNEEDLGESKKPCSDCGKEKCECEKVEEGKEVKTESSDATSEFVKDFAELLKKHSRAEVENMELSEDGDKVIITFKGGAQKTADVSADSITAAIRDIMKVVESKKVESVEIEVSDEGDKVEVTTDNGEEVEVIDETPEENEEDGETIEGEEEVTEIEAPVEENKKLENKKLKSIKEKIVRTKKEEEKAKIVKERVEKLMAKRTEAKKSFKYNAKSFNEALTNYYKRNTKTIESAEITKLNVIGKSIVVEAKLLNKDGMTKTAKLEMRPITSTGAFTKYRVTEFSNIKNESKENKSNITMLTFNNKNNITECRYINKK